MNKKWMTTLIVGLISVQGMGVMAMENEGLEQTTSIVVDSNEKIEESKSQVLTQVGTITEVYQSEGIYEILVGDAVYGTRFRVQPQTLLIDAESMTPLSGVEALKVGMNVTVVLHKNTPMTMSLPAICSEQVAILVNSENKQVEVGYFNQDLVNETNTLQLNIGKNTCIQNNKGERKRFIAADIANKDAIVIYTTSTRSIPAQTTPEYVMILDLVNSVLEDKTIGAEEISEATQVTYRPIREVAETLGYEVEWNHDTKTAILIKEDEKIEIISGFKGHEDESAHEGVINTKMTKLEDGVLYIAYNQNK